MTEGRGVAKHHHVKDCLPQQTVIWHKQPLPFSADEWSSLFLLTYGKL